MNRTQSVGVSLLSVISPNSTFPGKTKRFIFRKPVTRAKVHMLRTDTKARYFLSLHVHLMSVSRWRRLLVFHSFRRLLNCILQLINHAHRHTGSLLFMKRTTRRRLLCCIQNIVNHSHSQASSLLLIRKLRGGGCYNGCHKLANPVRLHASSSCCDKKTRDTKNAIKHCIKDLHKAKRNGSTNLSFAIKL